MNRLLQKLRKNPRNKPYAPFDRATEEDIYYCYRLFLKREPDEPGWEFWKKQLYDQKLTVNALTSRFLDTPEFLEKHLATTYAVMRAESSRIQLVELEHFKIYIRENDREIGSFIVRERYYEPHVTREMQRILRPGYVFLDIGANIGYFCLLAASIVGDSGKVVGFEPNPDNCELLKLSIEINGFRNISLHANAVAERAQTLLLEVGGSNGRIMPAPSQMADDISTHANVQNVATQGYGYFLVQAVAVDEVLQDVEQLHVVKMDIEGAEPLALKGMLRIIQKHHPVIFTEFSPSFIERTSKTAPEAYLDDLRSLGYDIFAIEPEAISPAPLSNVQIMETVDRYTRLEMNHLDLIAYPQR